MNDLLFIPAGTLVMCPGFVQGTVQKTDGQYVQVVAEDARREFWFPLPLLLQWNAHRLNVNVNPEPAL
ncbi:hypothetical protein [Deinococcus cellulosilyticus]|uniref:Uncharacterized protein n=1 Tax=Deinococcus cellulosilyticus (strain DSM 18568 / NBRC 106333 / KACC 11606 / 5516J-15) TaxID=1223518 RepID=A0A511MWD5_DEIC1|nr:hypothetical protein [Deinococcus cellulosilyticus]GEM44487.1 hypothetical protein DC3_01220 [Deinococcus cellulosilyticus NBRC 106333 = KACC 11606]